ncbi:TIGR02281 family clan AA aspartic protease [Sideroxydans lithotrophicus]|uniref:Aspartyl protease-like protein n=1 Tax=Sideroxydans lithotrophicus (strain ES-1) TaxID=580332 RepID=D5CLC6_SIDLE|nr:TIGR02281 family clan AA aspartic protease [Sideroxydans lithotrophicus]ADE10514.1 aspartyl protease-like protein [Sideroxydans lithotrophicus ES-1]
MKNTMLLLTAAILSAASVCAAAGTIFKCKNAAGEMLYQEKPCEKEVQAVSSWASSSASVESDPDSPAAEGKPLVIGQGRGGHYFIDGSVNDNYLNFVVDTGATFVALPLATAANAGLTCQGKGLMKTGNGVAQVCTTTIEKLKFGNFTLRYVQAVVMPNLSQPLLGMNVLKQFRVEQDNGEMRLSKKY